MRSVLVALAALAALAPAAVAQYQKHYDDAPLHAVQFVDAQEGWAVGDEGVVLHTIDGGGTWERQITGVRASLRALHFLNPFTGWAVGREELPHGKGSAGVLLFTRDGGVKWQRVTQYDLPGMNAVKFLDGSTGIIAGDGTDHFPTGVFLTTDSGRTWRAVEGPRCPGWLAIDAQPGPNVSLVGPWNRIARLRDGKLSMEDVDTLGGRNLRGVKLCGRRGVAVGQGALVLISDGTAGASWGYTDLHLPTEVQASWDFHSVTCKNRNLWIAGRPGTVILHSPDDGETWEAQSTGQPLPLNAVHFVDDRHGWAVGELGTVVGTEDGGKTWKLQRRGGQRTSVLFIHARSAAVPLDAVAVTGEEDGYLASVIRVGAPDPASAPLDEASADARLAAAVRLAGGAAGELLWQFPVPQHLTRVDRATLVRQWDRRHADRAAEQMLRQLVLALRMWQPDVIITDGPEGMVGVSTADEVVTEAVLTAFQKAADPQAFPEHLKTLRLKPWSASKLYACWPGSVGASITLDLLEPSVPLGGSRRDFAADAAGLLFEVRPHLPNQRHFRLMASRIEGAEGHRHLMQGIPLAPGGVARRTLNLEPGQLDEIKKAVESRRNLQALAELPEGGLSDPNRLLAQIGPMLSKLPEEQGARAAFAVASQYARLGQWSVAREAYLLMVDRYPAHPLSIDAYRWLIRHNTSSEARRRHEMGQFLVTQAVEFGRAEGADGRDAARMQRPQMPKAAEPSAIRQASFSTHDADVAVRAVQTLVPLTTADDTRRWYQGALQVEPRLAAFGTIFANEPAIQLALQAARRNIGEFEAAQKWCADFVARHPDGASHDAASAENWLVNRRGTCAKPLAECRQTAARPYLDGKLEDACWDRPAVVLRDAVGGTAKECRTEAWLAYDADFLYLAVRCRHPQGMRVEKAQTRTRDADLHAFDRVSLQLDLDRDYGSFFNLEVDQRGCLSEDCRVDPAMPDFSWNPRWFVAVHHEDDCWQVEAAIPMTELTGETITRGKAWACNVTRTLPGRGVQAWSLPADVEPRPEGMGLLIFTQPRELPQAGADDSHARMPALGNRPQP